jgi:hypothetical protein
VNAQHLLVAAILLAAPIGSLASEPPPGDTPEQATRTLIRTEIAPELFDGLYVQAARAAVQNFEPAVRSSIGRALTDDEKQRLQEFWQRKIRDLLPYSAIEDRLVPLVTKQLSVEELREINRFNSSPVGRKFAEMQVMISGEARAAGEELGKKLSDRDWQAKVDGEMKKEFPQLFPAAGFGK